MAGTWRFFRFFLALHSAQSAFAPDFSVIGLRHKSEFCYHVRFVILRVAMPPGLNMGRNAGTTHIYLAWIGFSLDRAYVLAG